jgi:hypothetical protein
VTTEQQGLDTAKALKHFAIASAIAVAVFCIAAVAITLARGGGGGSHAFTDYDQTVLAKIVTSECGSGPFTDIVSVDDHNQEYVDNGDGTHSVVDGDTTGFSYEFSNSFTQPFHEPIMSFQYDDQGNDHWVSLVCDGGGNGWSAKQFSHVYDNAKSN